MPSTETVYGRIIRQKFSSSFVSVCRRFDRRSNSSKVKKFLQLKFVIQSTVNVHLSPVWCVRLKREKFVACGGCGGCGSCGGCDK